MRIRTTVHVVGFLVAMVGAAMLLAAAVALIHREEDLLAHLVAAGIAIAVGLGAFFFTREPKDDRRIEVSHREAFAVVTFGWLACCMFGALPYLCFAHLPPLLFSDAPERADAAVGAKTPTVSPPDCAAREGLGRELCSPVNAVFESTSGFTTTGATILTDGLWENPETRSGGLPHGLLFWRALTHFLGGMGIIVLGVAILPLLGVGGMQLFKAEVPGPVKDKMVPRIGETARLLWKVYAGLTALEVLLLLTTGQGPYLAICHAFATMATGGFSPLAASIEGLGSPLAEWIVALFMFLAGINFALHFNSLRRRRLIYAADHEFRFYAALAVLFAAGMGVYLLVGSDLGAHDSLRAGVFQSLTILTTTGFSSQNFAAWAPAGQMLIFALFFVGGCSGSTGGGVKSVRVLLMIKLALSELKRLVHPHGVIQTKLSGRVVRDDVLHSVAGFVILYLVLFFVSALAFGIAGHDLVTSLTAVGASIGNIGPGLGPVGPSGNYEFLAAPLKGLCIFDMIAGRLEIYSVLIVLTPEFWRR
ncbi:MAG: TrkH family potassium uptake protein [Polyangia bacterium]